MVKSCSLPFVSIAGGHSLTMQGKVSLYSRSPVWLVWKLQKYILYSHVGKVLSSNQSTYPPLRVFHLYFFKKWTVPGLFLIYFRLFNIVVSWWLGFELSTSGVGSDRSTNWATITAIMLQILLPFQAFYYRILPRADSNRDSHLSLTEILRFLHLDSHSALDRDIESPDWDQYFQTYSPKLMALLFKSMSIKAPYFKVLYFKAIYFKALLIKTQYSWLRHSTVD